MMQNVIKSYKQIILISMPFPENDIWKMLRLGIGDLRNCDLSPKNLEDPLKLR